LGLILNKVVSEMFRCVVLFCVRKWQPHWCPDTQCAIWLAGL